MPKKYDPIPNELILGAIVAIIAIFGLEGFAIHKGLDGTMFGAAMAALGAIATGLFTTIWKIFKRK